MRGLLGRLPVRKNPPAVVLFGDDTLDPRDYLGLGSVAFVPSLSGLGRPVRAHRVREPLRRPGRRRRSRSRDRTAAGRHRGRPRRPSSTRSSAAARRSDPDSTQVVAVDDQGPSDVSFEGPGRARGAATLPVRPREVRARSRPASTSRARRSSTAGARARWPCSTSATAGADTWADEHLLTNDDAPSLDGIGPAPFVFTWTCQAQWYQYHLGPSVNEALLLVPNGGALATVGPTGISDPGLQAQLAEGVLQRLARGETLGRGDPRGQGGSALAGSPTRAEWSKGLPCWATRRWSWAVRCRPRPARLRRSDETARGEARRETRLREPAHPQGEAGAPTSWRWPAARARWSAPRCASAAACSSTGSAAPSPCPRTRRSYRCRR